MPVAILVVLLLLTAVAIESNAQSDHTLRGYLDPQTPLFNSTGFWFDVVSWAARTNNCVDHPESMACMACSSNVPTFADEMHVAPIGVGNDLWFSPDTSATCGMCLKVYLPLSSSNSKVSKGIGSTPYYPNIAKPWAYNAKIWWDEAMNLHYFVAIVVEWFDRNQTSATAITYPVANKSTDGFGEWEVLYRAIPCPVNGHNMTFQFMDFSKPFPLPITGQQGWTASAPSVGPIPQGYSKSLCNNQLNEPCGKIDKASNTRSPLQAIKMKVGGYRVPVGAVVMEINGTQFTLKRTGDNFWSPINDTPHIDQLNEPVKFYVQCLDGQSATWKETDVVPGNCLCAYQDPACVPCESNVQC
jgi:hypothetical protein